MKGLDLTAIDYMYVVVLILIGLVLATSPRSFMRKVQITEESIKAEDLLKKVGIGVIVLAIIMGLFIFFR